MNSFTPSTQSSIHLQIAASEILEFLCIGNIFFSSNLPSEFNPSLDDICAIAEILESLIGEDFVSDNSLDCCTKFKDFNYVAENYFGAHRLALMLGDHVRQPWMVAQSCNLWASIHKKFSFRIRGSSFDAFYSWPCIIGNDNRLVIPCADGISTYFVLCDEYWGFPCCVYDFKNKRFFSTDSSPVTRDASNSMRLILRNITAWSILHNQYLATCNQQKHTDRKPYIYVGGAPNPSHILWNYLGGVRFAVNCVGSDRFDSVICSTDLLFSMPDYGLELQSLHTYSELERIRILADRGYGGSISLRFTAAGLNPNVCREVSSSSNHGLVKPSSAVELGKLCLEKLLDFPHITASPDVVLLSIRSGKRKIANQACFFLELIKCLLANREHLWIILDGSSKGGWSQAEQDSSIAQTIISTANASLGIDGQRLSIRSAIGISISDQTLSYRFISSYLTYVSGGNAKIIPFCNRSGVVVGPSSHIVDNAMISLDDAIGKTGLQKNPAGYAFDQNDKFLLSHDYSGYSSLIIPPHAISGIPISHDQSSLGNAQTVEFNSDFDLDPHVAHRSLEKCLLYNRSSLP
jgi:hypothetical protein